MRCAALRQLFSTDKYGPDNLLGLRRDLRCEFFDVRVNYLNAAFNISPNSDSCFSVASFVMSHEKPHPARAGDKEAQHKRVYYQGTLETDKANYRALARRAGRRCLEHEGRMPVRQPYHSPR